MRVSPHSEGRLLAGAEAFARELALLAPRTSGQGELQAIIGQELVRAGSAIVEIWRTAQGPWRGRGIESRAESCQRIVEAARIWLQLLRDEGEADAPLLDRLLDDASALSQGFGACTTERSVFGPRVAVAEPMDCPLAAGGRRAMA